VINEFLAVVPTQGPVNKIMLLLKEQL